MMSHMTRVAVAQTAPAPSVEEAIARIEAYSAQAAKAGSQLLLFPEAFIGGYPRGASFGTVVGERTLEGRDEFRKYWEGAIDVPGEVCSQLAGIAARHRLYLVIGVIERELGTLYCTIIFLSPTGELMGKHRKLMPTGSERLIWGYGNGSTMPVFDTPLGKVGAVVCWENYMPLMRAAHYAKGIEIYCAPTADSRDLWLATMRHIAIEGRCFVLSANQFARQSDYPDSPRSPSSNEDAIVCRGGSCIIDPFGNILAGPEYQGEALLTADIDRRAIAQGKFDFDAVGHYSRPDIFSLAVNESDTRSVTFGNEEQVSQTPAAKQAAGNLKAMRGSR